jgi:two-component system phosphate regulon sensor histidine kinase PhoR
MNRTLGQRLAISHFLVGCTALAVVALWLPPAVEQYAVTTLERQLAGEARLVRRITAPLLADRSPARLQALTRQVGGEVGARVTVIDASGRVLADSLVQDSATMENHADRPEVRTAMRGGVGQSIHRSRTLGMDRVYVAVPVFESGAPTHPAPLGVVRLSLSLEEVHRYIRQLRQTLLTGVALAALAAVGLSLLLTRSLAGPLEALRQGALGWAQGDLSRRVPLYSRDEIGELAEAFNRMATRLQDSMAALARDRSQVATVFHAMAEGLLVTDGAGRVRLLNPAAALLLGVAGAEVEGRTVLEIALDVPLQALVEQVLRTGAPGTCERTLRAPIERVVAVSAVPIAAGGESAPQGAVLVFHDLTAVRRLERVRRDFVANASHELRTPLTSMRVMVETLLGGAREDPEAAERFLQILDRELRRMTRLVNDLLELSRLDAQTEPEAPGGVALAPLVADLEAGWQAIAREQGLRLEVRVPEPLSVRAEPEGLRQILGNLLDNALKYTPSGGQVRVTARRKSHQVVLEVADTGIGIPMADLDRIFERFYRVDKDRSRDVGGTGLGLSIVKHVVQLYGGSIAVESRLNQGSTFRVTLPVAEAVVSPSAPAASPL